MKTLVVGVGALGGLIAARLLASACHVRLATRDAASAAQLKAVGLRVSGIAGVLATDAPHVAPIDAYGEKDAFDLIVLATKAHDAIHLAPRLSALLRPGGTLLPTQNGGVSQLLADRLGYDRVLGGLSNFGVVAAAPGVYEQRNAGNLVIGEVAGGVSERAERVRRWLARGVEVRVTENFQGAAWSKLLLNCSVTTIGAIAGRTMRQYVVLPGGRDLFDRVYSEALSVAIASGARPERMIVAPVPPNWNSQRAGRGDAYDAWIDGILDAYGNLKASMLQDFERGRRTEVDFINGYVADVGRRLGIATPANAAIVRVVHAIEQGKASPDPSHLTRILKLSG